MKIRVITFIISICFNSFVTANINLSETSEVQFSSDRAALLKIKADSLSSPLAIYEYVYNNIEHKSYVGAQSDSVNVYGGRKGNAIDTASLLIAMLRSQGYEARYRVASVKLLKADVENWLKVLDPDVAHSELVNMRAASLEVDDTHFYFEHIWVETFVPYENYRGLARDKTINCAVEQEHCRWIQLDPSFKKHILNTAAYEMSSLISFHYPSYFSAELDNYSRLRDKNPLEIYEDQVLDWLKINAPGKGMDAALFSSEIVTINNGVLPSTLPYRIMTTPRTYTSVSEQSAAEQKAWEQKVTVTIAAHTDNHTYNVAEDLYDKHVGKGMYVLETTKTELSKGVFTFSVEGAQYSLDTYFSNGLSPEISGSVSWSYAESFLVEIEGSDIGNPGNIMQYPMHSAGDKFALVTGSPTSSWYQVHNSVDKLNSHSQNIIFDENNVAYIDNGDGAVGTNDQLLSENEPVVDELSKLFLGTVGATYAVKLVEQIDRVSSLNNSISKVTSVMGLVTTSSNSSYFEQTAFEIIPGGVKIDLGTLVTRPAFVDRPEFELGGVLLSSHILSSLEHEVLQEVTGMDALSTVRGMQLATAAKNASGESINKLVSLSPDDFKSKFSDLGLYEFVNLVAPTLFESGFYTIFGKDVFQIRNLNNSFFGTDAIIYFNVDNPSSNFEVPNDYGVINFIVSTTIDCIGNLQDYHKLELPSYICSSQFTKAYSSPYVDVCDASPYSCSPGEICENYNNAITGSSCQKKWFPVTMANFGNNLDNLESFWTALRDADNELGEMLTFLELEDGSVPGKLAFLDKLLFGWTVVDSPYTYPANVVETNPLIGSSYDLIEVHNIIDELLSHKDLTSFELVLNQHPIFGKKVIRKISYNEITPGVLGELNTSFILSDYYAVNQ